MKITYRGKTLTIKAKEVSWLGKFSGLMFRTRRTRNLFFTFPSEDLAAIHSFFVFFPFLALWLDDKNRVIDHSVVRPFTLLVRPRHSSKRLLELPLNVENTKIIQFFVGKGKI
jgi:uncharacterized membrane protein (UPF0127 family)